MPQLMHNRVAVIGFLCLFIVGCATRQVQTLETLPLPLQTSTRCCWQAVQQLDIHYNQQAYPLMGVLAKTHEGITLVLLDPFGRRLLSIRSHGDQLETYRSPELPESLPERFLLAASLFVWSPYADWQALLTSGWTLKQDTNSRLLSYRGRSILRATYEQPIPALQMGISVSGTTTPVHLEHLQQKLRIDITTNRVELVQ